jgi:hypothetical protein
MVVGFEPCIWIDGFYVSQHEPELSFEIVHPGIVWAIGGQAESPEPPPDSAAEGASAGHDSGGTSEAEIDAAIARLAAMSLGAYALARKGEAARLGIGVGFLDKLVAAARSHGEGASGQQRSCSLRAGTMALSG